MTTDPAAVKQCCANIYQSEAARMLLGDSFHPGGLALTGWRYLAGSPAQNGPPFRMIVDNGINVGMSSDGMQIAPMNPWIHTYYATTGRNARGVLINDGQQITRAEALHLDTRDTVAVLRAAARTDQPAISAAPAISPSETSRPRLSRMKSAGYASLAAIPPTFAAARKT